MSEDIDATTMAQIKKLPGMIGVQMLRTYQCQRTTKSGETQNVTIQVEDAGPDAVNSLRYSVIATADAKQASGNPDRSIEAALSAVHWWDLD
jgi:hypothetical protein